MGDASRSRQAVPTSDHVIITEQLPAGQLDQLESAVHLRLRQRLNTSFPGLGVDRDGAHRAEVGDRRLDHFEVLRLQMLLERGLVWSDEFVELVVLFFVDRHTLCQQELAFADQVDVLRFLPLMVHFLPSNQLLLLEEVLESVQLLGRPEVEERERLEELIDKILVLLFDFEHESLVVVLAERHEHAVCEAARRARAIVHKVHLERPLAKRLPMLVLHHGFQPLCCQNRSLFAFGN